MPRDKPDGEWSRMRRRCPHVADLWGRKVKGGQDWCVLASAVRFLVTATDTLHPPGEGTYAVVYRGQSLSPQSRRPLSDYYLLLFQLERSPQVDGSPSRRSRSDSSRMVSTCQLYEKSSTSANLAILTSSRYARYTLALWSAPDRSSLSAKPSSWMCILRKRTLTSS